ncbi:MAG: rRNA maturation RNase YbeY [bacterium]|nr:rRNA maturation RNase YbeY [bacterium]
MITVINKQHKIKVDTKVLKNDARHILGILNYADYDLGIWLTDNSLIQQYNKEYRNKDKPTDVLSFSYHKLKPGEQIQPKTNEDKNLGDIMISVEHVKEEYPKTFEDRVSILLIHGICHLLGYDHQTDEEYAQMKEMEDDLREKLALNSNSKKQ